MRPANFPARKDERRRRALERVTAYGSRGKLTSEEVKDLRNSILAKLNTAARVIRTKKDRTAFSRFAR